MSVKLSVSLRLAWVMQYVQHHLLIPDLCHILVKQGAVWLQYRISPLIFNFLLVYVTALTLLRPEPVWLPGAQAAIPESWRATQQGLAVAGKGPAQHLPFPSSLCTFGITLRALGMDGPGGEHNMQGKAEEGQLCGMRGSMPLWGMYLSQKGTPAPELKHVLYKPQDSTAYERLSFSVVLGFFISDRQNC